MQSEFQTSMVENIEEKMKVLLFMIHDHNDCFRRWLWLYKNTNGQDTEDSSGPNEYLHAFQQRPSELNVQTTTRNISNSGCKITGQCITADETLLTNLTCTEIYHDRTIKLTFPSTEIQINSAVEFGIWWGLWKKMRKRNVHFRAASRAVLSVVLTLFYKYLLEKNTTINSKNI